MTNFTKLLNCFLEKEMIFITWAVHIYIHIYGFDKCFIHKHEGINIYLIKEMTRNYFISFYITVVELYLES